MNYQNKKLRPCRRCGGELHAFGSPSPQQPPSFLHIRVQCKTCGEWWGGFTIKNHAKKE